MLIQAMTAVLDRVEEVDLATSHVKFGGVHAVAETACPAPARGTVGLVGPLPDSALARHFSPPPGKESRRPPR